MEPRQADIPKVDAERLLRCSDLSEILANAIVPADYEPPVQLTSSIAFTEAGAGIVSKVKGTGNPRIGLRETQLAVFIVGWAGNELLIDLDQIDVETLEGMVSSEICRGKIRFPWLYGRRLYDFVADRNLQKTGNISMAETVEALDGMPHGVFQVGCYVIGPSGLTVVDSWRRIPPRRSFPAYHCTDRGCARVHPISLSTGDSKVLRAARAVRARTEKLSRAENKFDKIISDTIVTKTDPYSWRIFDRVPFLLADCFALDDVRRLLVHLLNSTGGSLRRKCELVRSVKIGDAQTYVNTLGEADLIESVLFSENDEIHKSLNALIGTREIEVPRGELRYAKIVDSTVGVFSVELEVSSLGVRSKPSESWLPLRLKGVVQRCLNSHGEASESRVLYVLREYEGVTASAKLDSILTQEDPQKVIERLIVSDEGSCRQVLSNLHLPVDSVMQESDEKIARIIKWHLGFSDSGEEVELSRLTKHLDEIRKAARNVPNKLLGSGDIGHIRKVAAELFPYLEKVLKETLCFSVWAFIHDHYGSGRGLYYSPSEARQFFEEWCAGQVSKKIDSHRVDDMALGDLLTCLGLLAKYLKTTIQDSSEYLRDRSQWPSRANRDGNPLRFPFRHTIPFADLDGQSRELLVGVIQRVCSGMQGAGVLKVRNKLLHDSEEVPDRRTIERAADEIEDRVGELLKHGIYPVVFSFSHSEEDNNGRRRITLRSVLGAEVALRRPAGLDMAGFPSPRSPQLLILSARHDDADEPMRFRLEVDSVYREKWSDYPRKPSYLEETEVPTDSYGPSEAGSDQ